MVKQKLWFKKRTTRGGGRKVIGRERLTPRNMNREIYKNQRIYSHFLLKFALFMVLGLLWFRLGAPIGPIEVLPIGLIVGLLLAIFERFRIGQRIEIIILVAAAIISYISPVGIVV